MAAKTSRRLRNALVVLLVLVGLYATYRYTLHRMVEAKLDEIRKQGYPVTLAELDKWYPTPPPGENAADIYMQAFEHYVKNKSDTNLPIVGDARMPPRDTPLPAEMKQGIAGYLVANQEALDFLHKAATMRFCRYPSDVSDSHKMITPQIKQFGAVRQGERLLYLESLLASADGDTQRAVKSIVASLALAESGTGRSVLISYFVEHACVELTISSLEQALGRAIFNEQQLTELSDAFDRVETNNAFTDAVIGERAWAYGEWRELRTGQTPAKDLILLFPDRIERFDRTLATIYRPTGLVDFDYLGYMGFLDDFLGTTNIPFPRRLEKIHTLQRDRASLKTLPIARMNAALLSDSAKTEARLQAHLRAVSVALSVERYRVTKNVLPDSLGDLVPEFLTAVPIDPFDGQPLRYKKLAKGYVVYSVGEDGKDDGGAEPKHGYVPGTDITFTVER